MLRYNKVGCLLWHFRSLIFMLIPTDEDYLSFIASLQNPVAKHVEVDVDALCTLDRLLEVTSSNPNITSGVDTATRGT